MGVVECYIIDVIKEFSDDYVSYVIKGNLMYENVYFLVLVLLCLFIVKKLVEIVEKINFIGIVYGCIGKGND